LTKNQAKPAEISLDQPKMRLKWLKTQQNS
jgi:hypothetical protein